MIVGKIEQLTHVKVIRREQVTARADDESLRSLEISQMRILARKRRKEYLDIAREILLDNDKALTA